MNTTASFSSEHSWLASRRGSVESILSIQGKETDYVCDTSDTESAGDAAEYEPASEPEDHDGPVDDDSSEDSDEIITTKVVEVIVGDDGDLMLADSEQTDSDGSDSELDLYDYWACAQCLAKNNNPLYRYCEKCFKVRKNFFPPRPRPKQRCRTRTELDPAIHTVQTLKETDHATDSGVDSTCTSQELFSQQSQNTITTSDSLSIETFPSCNISQVDTSGNVSLERSASLNVIDSRKRRAESADRNVKRAKVDTDSETDISHDRKRKSKSADPEVKPLIKTISDPSLTIDELGKSQDDSMCIMCFSEPKSGVFVHGRIAHICCCYKCAVKVWSTAKRCPVCNCKVSNVLKAVVM